LSGLALIAGDRADVARKSLPWLQLVGPALKQSHGFLTTVTHLDGLFGFSGAGPQCKATVGALAGLAKTASHEWQGVACKAIDLSSDAPVHALADELFREGPLEVGITGAGRHSLELVSAPLPAIAAIPLGSSDVVVITGGARGVTAEVAVELARSGATLVLLGRSPDPSAESAELAACADEVAIKRLLSAQNGRSLREIDAESKTILAAREIRGTLERITAAGGKVLYRSVDIRDVAAVRAALDGIGAITGVIHGAGVLADRRLEDLTVEQFDSVYETKVGGLRNLLASIGEQPLKFLVLFSSSTGRFGRTGQAAYAAANEALNKIAQFESRRRPQCRVVALNWGPWAGGMVTPALANLFAAERIELISLADGAKHVLAELAAADRATEVVVLGGGSHLLERASEKPDLHFVFEREIDLERAPVLRAHVIDGRAVLPLALTLEWFAHAALHGQPGLVFQGCDRLRVFHPVLVRENQFTTVQVFANSPLMENGNQRIAVELRGRRPNGQAITHSRGEIAVGGSVASSPPARRVNLNLPAFSLDPDDVYQRILFHGPELRGIEQIVGCGPDGISVLAQSAPAPALWLDQPLRGQWITDPLVIDCAFQAMSLWCHSERGAVSLPSAVGRYRQYRRFVGGGPTAVDCRVVRAQGQVIVADIEFVDPSGVVIATIEGFECVLDPSLNQAFRRNRLEPAGT
jgi:NAD(P)-dependent dehydrogenase (short-subunit alcohol dehydrogenase family)